VASVSSFPKNEDKSNPQASRNRLLIAIIREKVDTISASELPEIATSFYEKLKFRHDQRDQAEQVFRDTVECLLKHHDKKVRKYMKYMKSDDYQFLGLRTCDKYWRRLATEHYGEVGTIKTWYYLVLLRMFSILFGILSTLTQKRELWNLIPKLGKSG